MTERQVGPADDALTDTRSRKLIIVVGEIVGGNTMAPFPKDGCLIESDEAKIAASMAVRAEDKNIIFRVTSTVDASEGTDMVAFAVGSSIC